MSGTDTAPLNGRSVLVTRAAEQAAGLSEPLLALGAEVLSFPVIGVADPEDLEPLDDAIRRIAEYDWLIITSTNGVDRFLDRAEALGGLEGGLGETHAAVVGSATAARLRERGFEPDLVPADFRAEGLIEEFRERGIGAGTKVLIARAQDAREILPDALREMGADVDVVVSYRVFPLAPPPDVVRRLSRGDIDIAAFASGGTFGGFLGALASAGLDADSVTRSLGIASIGPVTSAAVRRHGFDVAVEAKESTMASLVDAIVAKWGTR